MSYRSPAPLPDDVMNRLFTALVVRYGSAFTDRWRDLDLDIVKGDWARELGRFGGELEAIRFAIDRLPEKPPTVIDFKRLCDAAPPAHVREALTHNAAVRGPTPSEREALRRLAADLRKGSLFARPSRQWAYDLLACHKAGWRNGQAFHSTAVALEMAREAIATDPARWDRAPVDEEVFA